MNTANENLTSKMAVDTNLEADPDSIDTRHGYIMMLSSMLFFQLLNMAVSKMGSPKSVREDPWRWRNLFISWFHAMICGTWDFLWWVFSAEFTKRIQICYIRLFHLIWLPEVSALFGFDPQRFRPRGFGPFQVRPPYMKMSIFANISFFCNSFYP